MAVNDFLQKQEEAKKRAVYANVKEDNPISIESPNVQDQISKSGDVVAKMASEQPKKFNNPVAQEIAQMTPQEQTRVIASTTSEKDMSSVIDNAPGEQSVKDQVKKLFNNPKQLQAKQADIANKNSEGKPLGLVDSFVESLTFFLPTAVGAVVGGLVGGSTDAAVQGAEGGTKLAGAYRDFQGKNADRAIKQNALALDTASQEANALINAEGMNLRQGNDSLARQRLELEAQREERLIKQGNAKLGIQERSTNLAEAKAGQLSDNQIKEFEEIKLVKDQLKGFNLDTLKQTGPVEGRIRSLADSLGLEKDQDFIKLRTQIGSVAANYMRSISGATIPDQERKTLLALLPSVNDNNQAFVTKMLRFQDEVDMKLSNKEELISKGQSLKAKTVKTLNKETPKKQENNTNTEKPVRTEAASSFSDRLLKRRK